MPKKPKLPGAADFFKATDEPDTATAAEEETPAKKPRKAASDGAEQGAASEEARPTTPQPAPEATPEGGLAMLQRGLSAGQIQAAETAMPARSLPQPPTEKVTFYVPPQMLQQLEICRVRLLTEHGLKANRSQIAQAAIALSVHDPALIAETLLQLAQLWGGEAEE